MTFAPISKNLFFSKNDPKDPRLGDTTQSTTYDKLLQVAEKGIVIAGYPDDEGIQLNGGRPGAKDAPDSIRKHFYKMTPSALASDLPLNLYDIGNLETNSPLEQRQESIQKLCTPLLEKHQWISLGGGHDYAFPDGASFLNSQKSSSSIKPLIINIDAHLDVRPDHAGISSGTPFYKLLNSNEDFDFAEIGIQLQCNSREHLEWATQKGAKILSWEEINLSGLAPEIKVLQFLEPLITRYRPTFLSIDIDGFSSSFAMGCSQSWPSGFTADSFYRLLNTLKNRLDIRVLGIYEVSPPLDSDDRTSKLAAQIMHQFIFA